MFVISYLVVYYIIFNSTYFYILNPFAARWLFIYWSPCIIIIIYVSKSASIIIIIVDGIIIYIFIIIIIILINIETAKAVPPYGKYAENNRDGIYRPYGSERVKS
jgi:hypothetical protein